MNIKELSDLEKSFPTIMGLDRELILINELMKLSNTELKNDLKDFYKILNRLQDSHLDEYFNVKEIEKPQIENFINWLEQLKKDTDFNVYILDGLIAIFTIDESEEYED